MPPRFPLPDIFQRNYVHRRTWEQYLRLSGALSNTVAILHIDRHPDSSRSAAKTGWTQ